MVLYRSLAPLAFNDVFDRFFFRDPAETRHWAGRAPVSRVTEDERGFVIRVELPGYTEKDVTVDVEEGVLTLKVRQAMEGAEGKEQSPPEISRRFTFGEEVDRDKIEAEMKAGLLTVRLPKRAPAQPRQITVRAA